MILPKGNSSTVVLYSRDFLIYISIFHRTILHRHPPSTHSSFDISHSHQYFKMKVTTAAALSLVGLVAANPVDLTERQSCPKVYIFGARETTAPAGYGTSQGLVNQVKSAYPGAGSEAIVYPACGGQSSCGGASYDSSASQGTAAVVKAVTAYNQKCPDTQIVLIGYSQVSGFEILQQVANTCILTRNRVDKSWTMPFAVALDLLSPAPLSKPSRSASSWATRITVPASLTTLVLALLKA